MIAALLARRIPPGISGGLRMATGPAVLAAGLIPLALLSPGPLAQLVAGLVVAGAGAGS